MAQIGMGGFQAVGVFELSAAVASPSGFVEVPDNHFVIGQLSFSDIDNLGGGNGGVTIERKENLSDFFSFGFFSLGQTFFGNDSNGDPRVALEAGATGIYLPKGFYQLSIAMGIGSGATFTGTMFKNAPLVNQ